MSYHRPCTSLGAAIVGVVCLFATSCSVDDTLALPDCTNGGSALIVAQSVPSAGFLPCFEDVPVGWETQSVTITQDGSTVRFDSDRIGDDAARLRFAESCDTTQSEPVLSEWPDVQAFHEIDQRPEQYSGDHFYVFAGGCVWWEFDFAGQKAAARAYELRGSLHLVSRAQVNQGVHESFIEEDL